MWKSTYDNGYDHMDTGYMWEFFIRIKMILGSRRMHDLIHMMSVVNDYGLTAYQLQNSASIYQFLRQFMAFPSAVVNNRYIGNMHAGISRHAMIRSSHVIMAFWAMFTDMIVVQLQVGNDGRGFESTPLWKMVHGMMGYPEAEQWTVDFFNAYYRSLRSIMDME
jgi:hypothetical protein